MIEIIGMITLKLYGYGWLWGRRHWRENYIEPSDAFGNGGNLFAVGLLSMFFHTTVAAILFGAMR